jgi:hypothetical protein
MKIKVFNKKKCNFFFFSSKFFFKFLVIKTLDPDWIRIRIGSQPKMLDPDPSQLNMVRIRNIA